MTIHPYAIRALIFSGVLLCGCSSSKDSKKEELPPPPPAAGLPKAGEKVDTVTVDKQNTPAPQYDSHYSTSEMPTGKCSVQIGAYRLSDNAEKIVSLAKERFSQKIYMFQDKDNLFKVVIGDFMSKDDARRFRDEMAQKYPTEYKDAWVVENPGK